MNTTALTVAYTVFAFLVYALLLNWIEDALASLILTAGVIGTAIYLTWRYNQRKQRRIDLNRFEPIHVIGTHPETDEPPFLPRFSELGDPCDMNWFEANCVIVSHRDVQKEVARIEKRLADAKNRHGAKVYGYSFQEPIDHQSANECWVAGEDENSYPARIQKAILTARAKYRCSQYDAGADKFRKVVMGQTVEW